jgi:hypothetical protein
MPSGLLIQRPQNPRFRNSGSIAVISVALSFALFAFLSLGDSFSQSEERQYIAFAALAGNVGEELALLTSVNGERAPRARPSSALPGYLKESSLPQEGEKCADALPSRTIDVAVGFSRLGGYETSMHHKKHENVDERADDRRNAVNAADDTGLVAQQELIFETELEEDSKGMAGPKPE